MKLVIDNMDIAFVAPDLNANSEHLAAAGNVMMTSLNIVWARLASRGFDHNVVESLTDAGHLDE